MKKLISALIILPGTGAIFVPAIILYMTEEELNCEAIVNTHPLGILASVFFFAVGLLLSISTTVMFVRIGRGTPAPWAPPAKLVVKGPYRHVRNPMITGVVCILIAEAILCTSWHLGAWALIFLLGNMIYFPLFEEKGLERRFGEEYMEYKRNVPRWVPRLKPWSK